MENSLPVRSTPPAPMPQPVGFTPHAAMRWARLVAGVLTSPVDLRTLEDWARHIAVSRSAVKAWCEIAGASPRRSLLLGRILRAVEYRRRGTRFENSLDIRDRRTFRKLFDIAGRPDANDDVYDVVMRQQLVDDQELIAALTRILMQDERAAKPAAKDAAAPAPPWPPRPVRDAQPQALSPRP